MRNLATVFLLFSLVFTFLAQPVEAVQVQPEPAAPTDTPTVLVSGSVTNYTLAEPKLFWHTAVPACPPINLRQDSSALADASPEQLTRLSIYGGAQRVLYYVMRECNTGQILSNIVADDNYIYYLTASGLMRLSTDASIGDDPELMNALVYGVGELAIDEDQIFYIFSDGATKRVGFVWKPSKIRVNQQVPGNARDLKADGQYVYYRVGTTLYRLNPAYNTVQIVETGVSGYYPEGERTICIGPGQCFTTDRVYLGQGRDVYVYDNDTNTRGDTYIYRSSHTNASVIELVTDSLRVLFLERLTVGSCLPLCTYTTYVNRMLRAGTSPATIYTYGPVVDDQLEDLTTDGSYLYFKQLGSLLKLANNAASLPSEDLWITGMEVTQGIQSLTNTVPLIKGRRTYVRVYVRSNSVAVDGVTAILEAPGTSTDILVPVNPAGTRIKVSPNPDRDDIDQSFLFELPWSWVGGNTLTLKATLNPYKVPLEPDYSDNTLTTPAFNLIDSPSLSVEMFRLSYSIDGVTYTPREHEDIRQAFSYIQRLYPLGGVIGQNFKPRMWDLDGGVPLGNLVRQTDILCIAAFPHLIDGDLSLCASYFANTWLFFLRVDPSFIAMGLNPAAFFYGMITDDAGFFPRGQAAKPNTSVGPTGIPGTNHWDQDGSYGDWYAAHEIGHSLDRDHPFSGSDDPAIDGRQLCGHSRTDLGYPYGNLSEARSPIGPADGSFEGFDSGDPAFGIPMAVKPSSIWNDIMSYCSDLWISDYTYTHMYSYMLVHPSDAASQIVQAGDFLAISGLMDPAGQSAGFALVRRMQSVTNVPPLLDDGFALRLLDVNDAQLAQYGFTPEPVGETGMRSFSQVVNFVAGTRKVQVIKLSTGQVIGSTPVSAASPVVSGVALQAGTPSPVSGVVTLNWAATDPDTRDLTFDIFYSRDNGASFQPVAMGLSGTSAQVDTARLPGSSTGRFRVVASDGVNTGAANSAAFVMAGKPPEPVILSPQNNLHIHWGQLVNFEGVAYDVLDGTVGAVPGGVLAWRLNGRIMGSGARLSSDSLPVGTNTITFRATNSAGLSADTSITVYVDDDLDLPGHHLSAGPSQVGWHVPGASAGPRTAQVTINNTGSGSLSWTAGENAPWLTLSAASGTVTADGSPSVLTLTANPAGLFPIGTYSTTLTLTKPATIGSPLQTVLIPVTLSLGPVYLHPNPPPLRQFYLPFTRR